MNPPAPHDPSAQDLGTQHHSEGLRLAQAGRLREALDQFEKATRVCPDNAVWHFNRALALQHLKHLDPAIAAYRRAVELKPGFFDAWSNLSAALKAAGEIPGALTAGQTAVRLDPSSSAAQLNLGNALKASGDWSGAEACYRRALILDPNNPKVRLNLGNTLRELGRLLEAIPLFRQAVERSPDFAEAHRDLAFALLLSGDFLPGWAENEWRWRTEEMSIKRRPFTQPAWQGEALNGKRLLLYMEQGFGDAIQFVRYASLAAQRGATVLLECHPALTRLFERVEGVAQIITRGARLPDFDCHLPLLSLPRVFATTSATVPNRVPYLSVAGLPEPGLPPAAETALRVGIAWAGNPGHLNDQGRSLPFERLRPLLDMERVTFYSLQVGDRAADLKRSPEGRSVVDLSGHLQDFAATAAAITRLDLVISVDTAVAHLAGALAKPTWLLLPFAPDWRWMLGREDSPWYPTMRLLRQSKPGEWSAVIQRICEQLLNEQAGR